MVQSLLPSIRARASDDLGLADCDWALHPGGQATIDGVQRTTGLADERLRATREIYRTRGNSSSPTMLAVLDGLRCIDTGKGFVIATPFGPGLSVEMSFLRSCSIQPT
jgi:type III polyketide synthase